MTLKISMVGALVCTAITIILGFFANYYIGEPGCSNYAWGVVFGLWNTIFVFRDRSTE